MIQALLAALLCAAEPPAPIQERRPSERPVDPDLLACGGDPEVGWNLFRDKNCIA